MSKITVPIGKIAIGHYIDVPSGYIDHPFMLNSFRIKEKKQILILKKMGATELEVDTEKSLPQAMRRLNAAIDAETAKAKATAQQTVRKAPEPPSLNARCKKALNKATSRYKQQIQTIQTCFTHALLDPDRSIGIIDLLMGELQMDLSGESEFQLCYVGGNVSCERIYQNALNTLILILFVSKELNFDLKQQNIAAQIAILHNFGELYVPEQIRNNTAELTQPERNFYHQHPAYAYNRLKETEAYEKVALQAIYSHHERLDGSGYPKKLSGKQLSIPTQLISVIDAFEELINPREQSKRIAANVAVGFLFKNAGKKFNANIVNTLLKLTGIYPPGSVVKVNDHYGIVAISNTKDIKNPIIKLYKPDEVKQKVQFVDCSQTEGLTISAAKLEEVPEKAFDALNIPSNSNFTITRLE